MDFREPPHSVRLNKNKDKVFLSVTLHKIPPKCIKFEPTATRIYVDTLAYTKKLYLDKDFPEDIEVSVDSCDATFEYGVLKATFDVVGRREKKTSMLNMAGAKTNSTTSKKKEKKVQEDGGMDGRKANSGKKNTKATEGKRKGKGKDKYEKTGGKKGKVFLSHESALSLIDEVNKEADNVIEKKLAKEESKMQWEKQDAAEKEEKRRKKLMKKEASKQRLLDAIAQKKKEKKRRKKEKLIQESTPKRKKTIKFADEEK